MTTYAWPGWCVDRFEMRVRPNVLVFTGPYTPSVQTQDLLGERWYVSFDTVLGNTRVAAGEREAFWDRLLGDNGFAFVKDRGEVIIRHVIRACGERILRSGRTLKRPRVRAGEREAFWDRLLGPVHRVALWNLSRPIPAGTMRGGAQSITWRNNSNAIITFTNNSAQPLTFITGDPSLAAGVAQGANTITMRGQAGRTLLPGDMLGIGGELKRVVAPVTFDNTNTATVEFLPRMRRAAAAYTPIVWDRPTATFMLMSDGVPTVHRPAMFEGASVELIETFV